MNTILFNNQVSPGYFHMGISAPDLAEKAKPGQFVMISVRNGRHDPLLRRPMGIMLINDQGIEILYQRVGRGTEIMSRMRPEEPIDIIGPFGNGFDLHYERDAWIVAGGCGTAPFFEVAKQLTQKLKKGRTVRVFLGGKSGPDILLTKKFEEFGVTPEIATEDGTLGVKGLVTELLEKSIAQLNGSSPPLILTSGPQGMLKAVAGLAGKYNLDCHTSIDKRMACGFGVCLGCVVPVKTNPEDENEIEYKCVCVDGPVFNAKEIAW